MLPANAPVLCLLAVLLVTSALAAPHVITVSTMGPTKTLLEARDLARAYRAAHPDQPVTISVRGGYYFMTAPVVFGPEDCGLTIEGAPGAPAVLGSGRRISGWKEADGVWAADVPEVKEGKWDFRTLTVNGQWRKRAFLPKEGFFEHLSQYNEPWRSTTGGGFGTVPVELKRTMIYKPEDLGGWLSSANAELVIYHSWDMSHARIESNDTKNNVLTLTPPLGYPAGAFGIKRYKVENIAQGLHTPGLWYLDREKGRVVYWPLPGERIEKCTFIAPVGTELIKVEGKPDQPVTNLTIRNLTLADTNVPWKSPGFGAAGISETALTVAHAKNCALDKLHLRNLGGNAIRMSGGDANRIVGCHVEYVGASGIRASGDKQPGIGDNLVIADNHVHHCGMVYNAALGISTGNIANCRIQRNLVHDLGYCGIVFGGDMQNPRAINGIIEDNHIYRVMTQLNDGGGIYVSAQLDGTIIRNNLIHDIRGLSGQGWGIYPDEQSRFLTITGNLVYRCLGNIHCHMAHDIKIENNVLVNGDEYQVSLARSKDISFARNIFVCDGEPIFSKAVTKVGEPVSASDRNLFFDVSGKKPSLGQVTWETWTAAGLDANSTFADPLFADPKHDEYSLLDSSQAFKLGFKKLDLSRCPKGL
ncbi:MAG: right-handed parallel beta-helix repeat-containing protein [Armatimonadia bacterium]